jgi:sugar phosphate isomerase/epimerase
MNLGLSSLGHLNDRKIDKKYDKKIDLLIDATKACLEFCEENDVNICEILFDPPDITSLENQLKFIDMCSNFSIKKQLHGPYIDTNLSSHNHWSAKAAIETYTEAAKISRAIGSRIYTIHPGSSKFMFNENKVFVMDQLVSSTTSLLDAIADLRLTTCIENMQKKTGILLDLGEITSFFTKINREDIFFTWDTSHSWTCDINIQELWEKWHSVIKNIHIVDNTIKTSDIHPALGTGKINFKEIIELLDSYNYTGSLIIELGTATDSIKSIEYINKFH